MAKQQDGLSILARQFETFLKPEHLLLVNAAVPIVGIVATLLLQLLQRGFRLRTCTFSRRKCTQTLPIQCDESPSINNEIVIPLPQSQARQHLFFPGFFHGKLVIPQYDIFGRFGAIEYGKDVIVT